MDEFLIDNVLRKAAFLAQILHESGGFRYMEELGGETYTRKYNDREDLGNTDPEAIKVAAANGKEVGFFYKGHGPIQITGYYNHKKCGEGLHLDLVHYPRLITEPENGCRSAGWFWVSRDLNPLADKGEFRPITKLINGGYNGMIDRQEYYDRALKVLK